MRHERRRPSVGASYRCSLALADEAFSQNTYLLPGLDETDDPLSYVPKGRGEGETLNKEASILELVKNKYVPKFVLQVTGNRHLFDAIDALACRFLFQRNRRAFSPLFQGRLCEKCAQ